MPNTKKNNSKRPINKNSKRSTNGKFSLKQSASLPSSPSVPFVVNKPFYKLHSQSLSITRTPKGVVGFSEVFDNANGKLDSSFQFESKINNKKTSLRGNLNKNHHTFSVTGPDNKKKQYKKEEIITMINDLTNRLLKNNNKKLN